MNDITGIEIQSCGHAFDIFKRDKGIFEIVFGPIQIEFTAELAELYLFTLFDRLDQGDYSAALQVRSFDSHKISFQANLSVQSAKKLNKLFPELAIVDPLTC